MKIYTIKQRESGTGSIHDISSDLYDRDICFPTKTKYAVVMAAYYGGRGYTTYKTGAATIAASNQNIEYSHQIIDSDGNLYAVNYDRLELI